MKSTEEAWNSYRADKLTDPAKRYINDEREIFEAGWVAAQKRHPIPHKESVWFVAPSVSDEDPE